MTEQNPTKAASLAEEGKSLYRSKKYREAADSFSRAADSYAEAGDDFLEAEHRNNQAVALLMQGRPAEAERALTGTSAIFLQAGDQLRQGVALANQATALRDQGKPRQAREVFSEAAEIFRAAGEDQLYLQTMQSLSSLKLKNRDLTGALFAMQAGLQGLEKPTWRQKLLKNFLTIPNRLLGR